MDAGTVIALEGGGLAMRGVVVDETGVPRAALEALLISARVVDGVLGVVIPGLLVVLARFLEGPICCSLLGAFLPLFAVDLEAPFNGSRKVLSLEF